MKVKPQQSGGGYAHYPVPTVPVYHRTFSTNLWKSHRSLRGLPNKGIYTPILPNMDSTTDTEYVANLVDVNNYVVFVNVQHVQFITMEWYICMHNDIILNDIIGYDRVKFG